MIGVLIQRMRMGPALHLYAAFVCAVLFCACEDNAGSASDTSGSLAWAKNAGGGANETEEHSRDII